MPSPFLSRVSRHAILFAALLVAGACGAGERIAFDQLNPAEQRVLMPFAPQWPTLSAETQQNLRVGAQRWNALSADEKRDAAKRFGAWQRLPDAEKRRVRERYRTFRQLPPAQQQRLRGAYRRFQNLDPQQRAQMRQKFQRMSPRERRAFTDGMRAEQRGANQERWLQAIPEPQRAASLEMMSRFTAPERQRLLAHMRSLAPAQRDALREKLLAMSIDARVALVATLPQVQPAR